MDTSNPGKPKPPEKPAKPAKKPSSKGSKKRRWVRWLLLGILLLLLLPIVQVTWVRFKNPTVTPLMLLRPIEARWNKTPSRERQYTWLNLQDIPPDFLRCVILSEDQRFFQHHGFDWKEVAIAQEQARRKGTPSRGASTISMQCARSLFLWQGRSWFRKGLEIYYTFWMEKFLSKPRILELYANVIETGDQVYGIEAAAHAHYRKPAKRLTKDQLAMIVAILPNPRKWLPATPSPKLAKRHTRITKTLAESNFKLPF